MNYACNIFKNLGLVNRLAHILLDYFYIYYDNIMKRFKEDRGQDRRDLELDPHCSSSVDSKRQISCCLPAFGLAALSAELQAQQLPFSLIT
jgi:hypothetical protein